MSPSPDQPQGITLKHLLAAFLPLLVLYITVHILDLSSALTLFSLRNIILGNRPPITLDQNQSPSLKESPDIPPYFSLHRAVASYTSYHALALKELDALQRSYARLTYAHKKVGYELGYPRKLEGTKKAEEANAKLLESVAGCARREFNHEFELTPESGSGGEDYGKQVMPLWKLLRWGWREEDLRPDMGRAREAMKHFVRDWSEEGREERKRIFDPILEVLRRVGEEQRKEMKVLVPGCGLGRLAWEVSELGYDTTAVELSYFMTLAFRFLLSPESTQTPNQHTVHPYAHWLSHSRASENTLRGILFPDVVPRLTPNLHLIEGDFLKHHPTPSSAQYDYIITLFFIDTSLNIISTLEHIHKLLKPGGTWINLGPLLWTSGAQTRMELSLEEVLRLAEMVGFMVQDGRRTVECEYTADRKAMMKWLYQAEFWVATKRSV